MVSIFSIIINFALNWFFMFRMSLGHRGLALSTSLVALTNFLVLYIMMRKYAGSLETGAILGLLAKLIIPALLLAGICWVALEFLFQSGAPLPEWQKILGVLGVIAVAAAVFFGSAFLMRVNEVRDIVDLVRRRFARNG
jgi:putative peptidoglycan lipid II flippase